MITIIIKGLLILIGPFLINASFDEFITIVMILVVISITALSHYLDKDIISLGSTFVILGLCIFVPDVMSFLPLLCFNLLELKRWKLLPFIAVPVIIHFAYFNTREMVLLILLGAIAICLQNLCAKLGSLIEDNHRIRDNSIELQYELQKKNKALVDNLDYDIYLATLKERNRIAREIHDNVGHDLSRSILQVGAIQTINKEEYLVEPINSLKETLDSAMTSIRENVHGLQDDSIDLQEAIKKIVEPINCHVDLEYDLTDEIASNVKYCFLGIIKEAITNLSKHSDATEVQIILKEHPAFYQLLFHDNGSADPGYTDTDYKGMGISNMRDRVVALKGQFNVSYNNGFRIFVSIPKE